MANVHALRCVVAGGLCELFHGIIARVATLASFLSMLYEG